MISEIANSLFLTYLASEYLVSSSLPSSSSSSSSRARFSRTIQRADHTDNSNGNNNNDKKTADEKSGYVVLGYLSFLVALANLFDHRPTVPSFYYVIPAKLFLAATSYVLALYIDVHRDRTGAHQRRLAFRTVFLPKVGMAFLRILPAYPFLAVLISFVFMFVVDIWEYVFRLPLDWLNQPIYYGTLYGPFAYTYVYVKRDVLRKNHHEWTENHGYESNNDEHRHHNQDNTAKPSEFV